MELKVVCHCGQKYKFEVDPVNRQMPFAVNCPVCGVDGTYLANTLLMQKLPPPIPAGVTPAAAAAVAVAAPVATAAPALSVAATAPAPTRGRPAPYTPAPAIPKYMRDNPALQNNNFWMGVVGAALGAIVVMVLVVALRMSGLRLLFMTSIFSFFVGAAIGSGLGAIIAYSARWLYHGTDFTLGVMCGTVAFLAVGITLFLMFGLGGLMFSVSMLFAATASGFRIASD